MDLIPTNILQNKIFYFLLPDKYCDLDDFFNLKLVSKKWYNIFNNMNTWVNFLKKNNHNLSHFKEEEYFVKYNYSSHCVFNKRNRTYYLFTQEDWESDVDSDGEVVYIKVPHNQQANKIVIPHSKENKLELRIQNMFLQNHIRYSLLTFYPNEITCLFSVAEFFSIPVIKNLNADFLDNLMGDRFNEFESFITSGIMRGFDTKNRPFLTFKYRDILNNRIIVETIFFKYNIICNPSKKSRWTFTGRYNLTYIGLLADNNRVLGKDSFEYIKRLIQGDNCQVIFPEYNTETNEIVTYTTTYPETKVYLTNLFNINSDKMEVCYD